MKRFRGKPILKVRSHRPNPLARIEREVKLNDRAALDPVERDRLRQPPVEKFVEPFVERFVIVKSHGRLTRWRRSFVKKQRARKIRAQADADIDRMLAGAGGKGLLARLSLLRLLLAITEDDFNETEIAKIADALAAKKPG
jgi:hypothetical protein